MHTKIFLKKMMHIEWYRILLLSICLFAALYSDTKICFNGDYVGMTTLEFLVYIMNAEINICFYLLFAIFITAGDIFWNVEKQILYTDKKKSVYFLHMMLKIFKRVLITIFYYLAIGILVYLINGALNFTNEWTLGTDIGTPLFALLFSIIFLIARLSFFGIIIATINVKSKYPFGIVVPIIMSMIDYWFYYIFNISIPLFILPIEHTRVFYTEAVAPTSDMYSRVSYFSSFLYWGILIFIAITIFKNVLKNKLIEGRKDEE